MKLFFYTTINVHVIETYHFKHILVYNIKNIYGNPRLLDYGLGGTGSGGWALLIGING